MKFTSSFRWPDGKICTATIQVLPGEGHKIQYSCALNSEGMLFNERARVKVLNVDGPLAHELTRKIESAPLTISRTFKGKYYLETGSFNYMDQCFSALLTCEQVDLLLYTCRGSDCEKDRSQSY